MDDLKKQLRQQLMTIRDLSREIRGPTNPRKFKADVSQLLKFQNILVRGGLLKVAELEEFNNTAQRMNAAYHQEGLKGKAFVEEHKRVVSTMSSLDTRVMEVLNDESRFADFERKVSEKSSGLGKKVLSAVLGGVLGFNMYAKDVPENKGYVGMGAQSAYAQMTGEIQEGEKIFEKGTTYFKQKNFNQALDSYNSAKVIFEKSLPNESAKEDLVSAYQAIGATYLEFYFKSKDKSFLNQAETSYNSSLKLVIELKDKVYAKQLEEKSTTQLNVIARYK